MTAEALVLERDRGGGLLQQWGDRLDPRSRERRLGALLASGLERQADDERVGRVEIDQCLDRGRIRLDRPAATQRGQWTRGKPF